jgi:hypothetical protein
MPLRLAVQVILVPKQVVLVLQVAMQLQAEVPVPTTCARSSRRKKPPAVVLAACSASLPLKEPMFCGHRSGLASCSAREIPVGCLVSVLGRTFDDRRQGLL